MNTFNWEKTYSSRKRKTLQKAQTILYDAQVFYNHELMNLDNYYTLFKNISQSINKHTLNKTYIMYKQTETTAYNLYLHGAKFRDTIYIHDTQCIEYVLSQNMYLLASRYYDLTYLLRTFVNNGFEQDTTIPEYVINNNKCMHDKAAHNCLVNSRICSLKSVNPFYIINNGDIVTYTEQ